MSGQAVDVGGRDFGGKCRVPMWVCGTPAGFCDEPAIGPQLPLEVLRMTRGWNETPYCHGPCCPKHGGPRDGEPIVFQDGWTAEGRPMWCAVMPGFRNLQEDHAGFDGNANKAIAALRMAMADDSIANVISGIATGASA